MIKTVEKTQSLSAYKKLADLKADKGDFMGALGLYMTALNCDKTDYRALADVADCYADMGLLELSNKYWFKYLAVAPKDKQSAAYEELAINFFYMDNLWASGYYFHLKVERDGFVSEEGLDEEIVRFFSATEMKKDAYYLAYPFDKADYSSVRKSAKRVFAAGDYGRAVKQYSKIPAECRTEEISGDYAAALFLEKKDDEVIEVCKDSLARHGENVTALCGLASLYRARGDEDKADYYYERALKAEKGEEYETYRLAACAIERGDDVTAERTVAAILKERPYDDVMNFFYGIAELNLKKYEEGARAINVALKISPEDAVYAYFSALAKEICADNSAADAFLPFRYEKALPESTERAYRREINGLINGKKSYSALSDTETLKRLRAELFSGDLKTAKSAAFLLSLSKSPFAKETMLSALMDGETEDEIKSTVLYLLISGGIKEPVSAVIGNYFVTVKPRKVVFEHKSDGAAYMSAYALALAKSVFFGVEDTARIAFNANLLYTGYNELIRFNGFGPEAVAAVCFLMCGFPRFVKPESVFAAFGVKKADAEKLKEFYTFIKEDRLRQIRNNAAAGGKISEKTSDKEGKTVEDN